MSESISLALRHNTPVNDDDLAYFDAQALGLECLGGDVVCEQWAATAGSFGMVSITQADPPQADPASGVEQAYLELAQKAQSLGFDHWLRIWQFIPAINQGRGDDERYRRFCVGRARALALLGLSDQRMCAATAIGCHDDQFRLFALVGKHPGRSIENPRQISAWQYPRQYGPVSPAFARATALSLNANNDAQVGLLISGTASVVGHASQHVDDVVAQTKEAMNNVEAVIAEAERAYNRPMGSVGQDTHVRAYVRQTTDGEAVLDTLRERWPNTPVMGLRGDICRPELLVEIEAWHPSQL